MRFKRYFATSSLCPYTDYEKLQLTHYRDRQTPQGVDGLMDLTLSMENAFI